MLNVAKKNILSEVLQIFTGIGILAICSQITVNIKPVPITLQTLWIIAIPYIYQSNKSLAVISGYLMLGALGLPVFSNLNSGITVFTGPTGGYLLGLLASVAIMNLVKTRINIFFTCLLGQAMIYIVGIACLSQFVGFYKAIYVGFMPFIIPGLIKTVMLIGILRFFKVPILIK